MGDKAQEIGNHAVISFSSRIHFGKMSWSLSVDPKCVTSPQRRRILTFVDSLYADSDPDLESKEQSPGKARIKEEQSERTIRTRSTIQTEACPKVPGEKATYEGTSPGPQTPTSAPGIEGRKRGTKRGRHDGKSAQPSMERDLATYGKTEETGRTGATLIFGDESKVNEDCRLLDTMSMETRDREMQKVINIAEGLYPGDPICHPDDLASVQKHHLKDTTDSLPDRRIARKQREDFRDQLRRIRAGDNQHLSKNKDFGGGSQIAGLGYQNFCKLSQDLERSPPLKKLASRTVNEARFPVAPWIAPRVDPRGVDGVHPCGPGLVAEGRDPDMRSLSLYFDVFTPAICVSQRVMIMTYCTTRCFWLSSVRLLRTMGSAWKS
ncbi:MAG: hypothetical protein GY696_31980, partial [Gammaproteobacteria bacterium]|nr:hypothetical protein [Gammaproteobacteria bacterium]